MHQAPAPPRIAGLELLAYFFGVFGARGAEVYSTLLHNGFILFPMAICFGSSSLYFYFVNFLGQYQAFISGCPADGRFGAFWGVLWLKPRSLPHFWLRCHCHGALQLVPILLKEEKLGRLEESQQRISTKAPAAASTPRRMAIAVRYSQHLHLFPCSGSSGGQVGTGRAGYGIHDGTNHQAYLITDYRIYIKTSTMIWHNRNTETQHGSVVRSPVSRLILICLQNTPSRNADARARTHTPAWILKHALIHPLRS